MPRPHSSRLILGEISNPRDRRLVSAPSWRLPISGSSHSLSTEGRRAWELLVWRPVSCSLPSPLSPCREISRGGGVFRNSQGLYPTPPRRPRLLAVTRSVPVLLQGGLFLSTLVICVVGALCGYCMWLLVRCRYRVLAIREKVRAEHGMCTFLCPY